MTYFLRMRVCGLSLNNVSPDRGVNPGLISSLGASCGDVTFDQERSWKSPAAWITAPTSSVHIFKKRF